MRIKHALTTIGITAALGGAVALAPSAHADDIGRTAPIMADPAITNWAQMRADAITTCDKWKVWQWRVTIVAGVWATEHVGDLTYYGGNPVSPGVHDFKVYPQEVIGSDGAKDSVVIRKVDGNADLQVWAFGRDALIRLPEINCGH